MRSVPNQDHQLTITACDRAMPGERLDVEDLIRACVPDAATCDPSVVADAIREWFDCFDYGIPAWEQSSQER